MSSFIKIATGNSFYCIIRLLIFNSKYNIYNINSNWFVYTEVRKLPLTYRYQGITTELITGNVFYLDSASQQNISQFTEYSYPERCEHKSDVLLALLNTRTHLRIS